MAEEWLLLVIFNKQTGVHAIIHEVVVVLYVAMKGRFQKLLTYTRVYSSLHKGIIKWQLTLSAMQWAAMLWCYMLRRLTTRRDTWIIDQV